MNLSFSLDQLYIEYKPIVMSYISARVYCNEDAEDLCADVFVKFFGLLESYDEKRASVSTLLYKITHDAVIDYYRCKREQDELSEDHAVLPSSEDIIMDRERADELIKALSKLPQQQRDILILRFYRGWTLVRIAEEMGLSYNKVVSRQNSAFKALKEMLGK